MRHTVKAFLFGAFIVLAVAVLLSISPHASAASSSVASPPSEGQENQLGLYNPFVPSSSYDSFNGEREADIEEIGGGGNIQPNQSSPGASTGPENSSDQTVFHDNNSSETSTPEESLTDSSDMEKSESDSIEQFESGSLETETVKFESANDIENEGLESSPSLAQGTELNIIMDAGESEYLELADHFVNGVSLSYSIHSTEIGASIDGTTLTVSPGSWTGTTTIEVKATSSGGTAIFDVIVEVRNVYHPLTLVPIGDVEFNQGISKTIDLSKHFIGDGDISYEISSTMELDLVIDGHFLTITADWCWYGNEWFIITASNPKYSVSTLVSVRVSPLWIPVTFPEVRMNPVETEKRISISDITEDNMAEVRVICDEPMLLVEVIDGEIIITPLEGWTGEAVVEVMMRAEGGQVGTIQIPVVISENIRPLTGWVWSYMFGMIFAGMFVSGKTYRDFKLYEEDMPDPTKLDSYRHFTGGRTQEAS